MHRTMTMKVMQRLFAIFICSFVLMGCSTLKNAKPWHRIVLDQEFKAQDVTPTYQWADYLAQEEKLFAQVQQTLVDNPRADAYRYQFNSPLNSFNHPVNWNRSFVLKPQQIRGGVVILHGLSDSPYSVRSLALHLQQQGFYVIAPRLPGHGTLPTGLLQVQWEDWAAVTKLAMRELQRQLGENRELYILGYSAGGALAVSYSLEAQADKKLPSPKKLVLLSPMFGVTEFAVLSKSVDLIGHLPLLSAERWLTQQPEYNPFKYNSFTVNAGWQARRLTTHLQSKIDKAKKRNGLEKFPPSLGFQSLMDASVNTPAIEQYFYRLLPNNNSELVVFDINRNNYFVPITRNNTDDFLNQLFDSSTHNYNLVKISNRNANTDQVSEWRRPAGSLENIETPLALEFPRGVFSLSHIAVPFPINDPTYGLEPDEKEFYGIRLGNLNLRGEKNTLIISADTTQRLNANPFYTYMEKRIDEWLGIQ